VTLSGGTGAWLAIVGLGWYHGINPGMGWLFAVSNGMQERRGLAVFTALPPIALGHWLAMAVILLPVALLTAYVQQIRSLRLLAAALLIGFGVYKLVNRRHPRVLARIGSGRLILWSFLMATAHGAGLMLVPVYLAVSAGSDPGVNHATMPLMAAEGIATASLMALVHTVAMLLTGGLLAWVVYRYLGLKLLQRVWFNFDLLWAGSLIVVGALALIATTLSS